ncbi:N-acetyltransferase [Mycolicibacterium hodleri]|uniref:N-acetyltransferase n=1 Tax=Mycolicibacterium hodleri TaxID=49897 RepID=A0A502DPT1_9MYCO|nr:N-acetyltransferase [Mycolicibacterium hodleri]TPG27387.1 N-acetyltransferase [Mycolicibacterium hodleri]
MSQEPFVPVDFEVPRELRTVRFRLEPLGPQHNASDHAAWTSSISHIQSSPGFVGWGWPPDAGMSAEANLADLERHADEFERRVAFAYTVLRPDSEDVIGCLYLNPGELSGAVGAWSWVRADVADLDPVLRQAVRTWLADAWPFDEVVYAG